MEKIDEKTFYCDPRSHKEPKVFVFCTGGQYVFCVGRFFNFWEASFIIALIKEYEEKIDTVFTLIDDISLKGEDR